MLVLYGDNQYILVKISWRAIWLISILKDVGWFLRYYQIGVNMLKWTYFTLKLD